MSRLSKVKSLEVVASVAVRLEDLLEDVVFVGGSAAAFLITDEPIVGGLPHVRCGPDRRSLEPARVLAF